MTDRLETESLWTKFTRLWSGDLGVLGVPPLDDYAAGRMRVEQINTVIRYTQAMMLANIVNGLVLVAALWTSAQSTTLMIWLLSLIVLCLSLYLRRTQRPQKKRPLTVSSRVIRLSSIYAGLLGSIWGLAPLLFFANSSTHAQVILICLTSGMICSGAFVLATLPSAAISFTIPITLGFIIGVLQTGEPIYISVAILTIVYLVAIMRAVMTFSLLLVNRVLSQIASEKAAETDALTGLPNRMCFTGRLETVIEDLTVNGIGFCMLYLDFDDFKSINDRFGHAAGDDLLIEAAGRMRACLRETDCISRLGGDEFAVIGTGIKEQREAGLLAERLLATFAAPFQIAGESLNMHPSIGIAMAPLDGQDAQVLLRKADAALYHSKRERRGSFHFFKEEFDGLSQDRKSMETDLREALKDKQFHLVYQPFLNLVTHEVTGYEALLRWDHPVRGSVPPSDFIPIAELSSLIDEIGDYVLREALHTAATWPSHLRLAVNLSIRQLRNMSVVDKIRAQLAECGVPAHRLELEITESKSMASTSQVVEILHKLREHGISIALDDFGTGYSSMTYLCHLPVDRIKIDRLFISGVESHLECASIVKASVHLAVDLGRKVIAEGVETPAQLAFLEKLNCHEAQGYLIARPMPADQIAGFRPQLKLKRHSAA